MKPISPVLVSLSLVGVLACGGSKSTAPPGNSNTGTGTTRTMTMTYNGVAYSPNILISAYLGGSVTVNAADGTRNLSISAQSVGSTGTYSVSTGSVNSGLVQWIADTGTFSSIGANAGGTVTFTILQLGRVAGSFNVVVRNTASQGALQLITLVGTFDIPFP
jgi:hypothetical protein